jgi:hypothetical protein
MIDYVLILTVNFAGKAWAMNGNLYSTLEWLDESPKPTQAELDALWPSTQETIAKQNCKKTASALLYETDWTTIPDVASPANNPYLTNQLEFIAYRNVIRGYAVNPVVDPVWPITPTEQWSST